MFEKCNSYNTLIKSIPIINEIYKVINTIITLLWLCLCLSGVFYFTWKVVPRLCNFAPYSFSEMILLFGLFLFNIIFFYFVVKTFVNSVSPLFFKKMIFSKGLCKALFLQITYLILILVISYTLFIFNYFNNHLILSLVCGIISIFILFGELCTVIDYKNLKYINVSENYNNDDLINKIISWFDKLKVNLVFDDIEHDLKCFLSKNDPLKLYVIPNDTMKSICEITITKDIETSREPPCLRYIKIDYDTIEYIELMNEFKKNSN